MLFTAACVVLATVSQGNGPELDHQEIARLRELYVANRAAFAFGTFRFDQVTAKAASPEDARNGRFEQASTGKGLYVLDGSNARLELQYDIDQLVDRSTKVGKDQARSSIHGFRALTDGHSTLWDEMRPDSTLRNFNHAAQINPGIHSFFRDFQFPFEIGQPEPKLMNFAGDLDKLESGEFTLLEFEKDAQFEGSPTVHLKYQAEWGTQEYWIDPDRGAVPLQMICHMNEHETTAQLNYDDLRETEGGWLPFRTTFSMDGGKHVIQIVIHDAEVKTPPVKDEFQLTFPAPTKMVDAARNLIYEPRPTWSLLDLPSTHSTDARALRISEYVPPPVMPGERQGWTWGSRALYAAATILAIAAVVQGYRMWQRRRG